MDKPAYSNDYVNALRLKVKSLQKQKKDSEDLLNTVLEAMNKLIEHSDFTEASKFLMSHIPTVECP